MKDPSNTVQLVEQLTERLTRLETINKQTTTALIIITTLLLSVVILGAAPKQNGEPDIIKAKMIQLINDEGNVIAELGYDSGFGTGRLSFIHPNGIGTTDLSPNGLTISSNSEEMNLSLTYYPEWDLGPSLRLFGSNERILISADDQSYGTNIVLEEHNYGEDSYPPAGCTVNWDCP